VIEAVIFDLDDTLVDTSAVRAARDNQDWTAVKENLHRIVPFASDGVAIEETPARLKAEGMGIGILTHAPRWYAETLLDRFGIRADVLITGSDGYPPKPDPTSLKALAAELGVAVGSCAYVGDMHTDAAAAAAAGAVSVGACWAETVPHEWRRWWPDVAIAKPERLLELDEFDRLGPLAEVVLGGRDPRWHWGTLMRIEPDVRACGRYFTPEDVERFPGHALSQLLLEAKESEDAATRVAEIFVALAGRPAWRRPESRPQLIVSVPPKPGQDYDRFTLIRSALAGALGAVDGVGVLTMRFDVANYKRMSHDERRAVNRDRFAARTLGGERVLLIDDVLTSGGQVEACRDALLRSGAGWVGIVALAATQDRLPEGCPFCGGRLRIYTRRSDSKQFVGCPNFFSALRCPYTRDL
jgi:HAD superfamily hydrolase (TIGR01549 family)